MKWRQTPQGRLATEANELSSKGDHSQASALLERALSISPNDPLVLVYRGRVLHALARDDEAEQSFRDALRIDEMLSYGWTELGLLFKDQERFEEAAFCLRESARLRPDFNIYTVLANVELAFDANSALADAKAALELNPTWDEAIEIRDAALEMIKRTEEG